MLEIYFTENFVFIKIIFSFKQADKQLKTRKSSYK